MGRRKTVKSVPMPIEIDEKKKKIFVATLLQWFEINYRDFPWRKEHDPYKILVSEILLQKTRAENVVPIYNKFIKKYSDIQSLHAASYNDIKDDIKLIGLSSQRAKKFKLLAEILINKYSGKVPRHEENLLELPGIGFYVGNAVVCFAFGEDAPLLDTNIGRIIERIFSLKVSGEERKKTASWKTIANFIPEGNARAFNYALIDFGAIICTARNPKHNSCPLIEICDYASNIK